MTIKEASKANLYSNEDLIKVIRLIKKTEVEPKETYNDRLNEIIKEYPEEGLIALFVGANSSTHEEWMDRLELVLKEILKDETNKINFMVSGI